MVLSAAGISRLELLLHVYDDHAALHVKCESARQIPIAGMLTVAVEHKVCCLWCRYELVRRTVCVL